MMSVLRGHDREVREWIRDRIGPPVCSEDSFTDDAALGVLLNGRLVAGIVFHDWYPRFRTCELSMASITPVWARPEIIADLLSHPFRVMDVFKLYTCTNAANRLAINVNIHVGFSVDAVLEHQYGPGEDCVICKMLRPDYEQRYGGMING